jgi:hypothetical protein
MQKPHRFLIERVSSYADEGAAFLRRRRHRGRSFVRVWREGGAIESVDPESPRGRAMFDSAGALLAQGCRGPDRA